MWLAASPTEVGIGYAARPNNLGWNQRAAHHAGHESLPAIRERQNKLAGPCYRPHVDHHSVNTGELAERDWPERIPIDWPAPVNLAWTDAEVEAIRWSVAHGCHAQLAARTRRCYAPILR